MKPYDVILVGAGPAGIFAALELTKAGKRVALVDKGRAIRNRVCPLKEGSVDQCIHCRPCNVVCGWGGAGAYSDGKLTLTPEFGGNLEQYCGRVDLVSLIAEVDRVYVDHGASEEKFVPEGTFANQILDRARRAGLEVIPATIRHMGTDRSKEILSRLREDLEGRCDILLDTPVEDVLVKDGRAAGVRLGDGTLLAADTVLLAPGREGAAWMEDTVRRLGLSIESLPVDIGVRVEIPAAWAKDITDQFYEIKAILDTPTFDDRVRTFCMCPNGEVTTEYQTHHDILTVNGHSNRDEGRKTENTNFAILVSTQFTKPFKDPNGYGSHVARLANMLGDTVLVQRLGDLKRGRRSTADRIARGLVRPTLKTAEPGDLSFVLPYRHLVGILEMLAALDPLMPGINGNHTLLYGVEVKFYSLKLALASTLETSIPGLFAAGDGAGVTRGVIQASASGLWAARAMLRRG
ncbi:NAD(P)/FAD-dependent oxidoreductase [Aminomonas paucivorans]|uniref:Monooxygenase FAD-binding n=1 Tax=Aminomonas paucivorans DSM 12260 TaxID=584708 RepID=E3CW37_9BACT|nr:FAD-dependent oxidoreductase [Aminomonas paucivorans]EFQ24292.1 monooxygenase FAD-binding [Aminomonas paucivorans DSM 12260]